MLAGDRPPEAGVWLPQVGATLDTQTLEYRYYLRAEVCRHYRNTFERLIGHRPYRVLRRTPIYLWVEIDQDSIEDARRTLRLIHDACYP